MSEALIPGVSISWVKGHRRSREIAEVLGVEPHFVRGRSRLLPLRYLQQHQATQQILRESRPKVIVVMQPPPLSLASVLGYARRHKALVIGDLHSGVFLDRKWAWAARWVLRTLRRRGGAVVPNADLAALCQRAKVPVFVSHGWITPIESSGQKLPSDLSPSDTYVLVPFAYSDDEPLGEVLAAAASVPEITWVLTGKAPTSAKAMAPSNVVFTGYVTDSEFKALLLGSSAVLALTTRKSTMQSAGYEAVAAATPLITVSDPVLVDYFGDAAIYTILTPKDLALAVARAVQEKEVWAARMSILRDSVMKSQPAVSTRIRSWIKESLLSTSGQRVGQP